MNRKLIVILGLVAAGSLAPVVYLCWITHQPLTFGFPGWSVTVRNVRWNVATGCADFILTLEDHYSRDAQRDVALAFVEVNGMRAATYPEHLVLRTHEQGHLRVYFPYVGNQTYSFCFYDEVGNNLRFWGRSPSS